MVSFILLHENLLIRIQWRDRKQASSSQWFESLGKCREGEELDHVRHVRQSCKERWGEGEGGGGVAELEDD